MDVSSGTHDSVVMFLLQEVLLVDATISLHPFFMHRLDVGPIRLTPIANAFNYRVTVLRDGVKSAAWVGRSRRAVERILEDIAGACMVYRLMLFCPATHGDIWAIVVGIVSVSLRSNSMGAYVHDLSLATKEASPVEDREDLSSLPCGDYSRESQLHGAHGFGALCV